MNLISILLFSSLSWSAAPQPKKLKVQSNTPVTINLSLQEQATSEIKAEKTGSNSNPNSGMIHLKTTEIAAVEPAFKMYMGLNFLPVQWSGNSSWGSAREFSLSSLGSVWMTEVEGGIFNNHPGSDEQTFMNRIEFDLGASFGFARKQMTALTPSGSTDAELRQIKWAVSPGAQIFLDEAEKSRVLIKFDFGQSHLIQSASGSTAEWNETHRYWMASLGFGQLLTPSLLVKFLALDIHDASANERWNFSQKTYQLGMNYRW